MGRAKSLFGIGPWEDLNDLLELLEQDPGYVRRAEELGIRNLASADGLVESIDFAVFKFFALEPPAFRLEYDAGVTVIRLPLLPGMTMPCRCFTAAELVAQWLAESLHQLERDYKERFPEQGSLIQQGFRQAAERHGQAVFGPGAYDRAAAWKSERVDKILAQFGLGPKAASGS